MGAEEVQAGASNSARVTPSSPSSSPEQREEDRPRSSLSPSSKLIQTDPVYMQLPRVRTEGLLRPSLSITDTRSSAEPLSDSESDRRYADLLPPSAVARVGVDHARNSAGVLLPSSTIREKSGNARDSRITIPSSSKPPRHPDCKSRLFLLY